MKLYESKHYINEVAASAKAALPWGRLQGKKVAITGATGMIGSFLIDVLMYRNTKMNQQTDVYAIGRSKQRLEERFAPYVESSAYHSVEWDINEPFDLAVWENTCVDYLIHGASNTHPVAYASDPIGTISANVIGTDNLLKLATKIGNPRFVFLSSVEIYGENRGDTDSFAEDYLGYIDCNTLRAGYPESKRTGEALCQAYKKQMGLSVVIPRLSRVYGPTMLMSDTKALSQFILKGVEGEDIVLKSEGTQLFSYSYVADAVTAICKIMLDGSDGAAYNIVSKESNVRLRDLASHIADYTGKKVIFELPNATEQAGFSKATKATLNVEKLCKLGWESQYDIVTGLQHTIDILRDCQNA
ncbi:MAG: NAD-dependent epimerase/dehydratase family protein [Eubacteriales bacterium]|nr:NAD-dependent epimerase/dehydratase family protein [Eubacteriales bacterium]